jgi:NAD(P)-dependent dehydrogenase (short-subunit alcohol dehydrogenase family)
VRILVVGATGTIGRAVVEALQPRHAVIAVSLQQAAEQVDIGDPGSIRALYQRIGQLDAVVSTAGRAVFKPLSELSDSDFQLSLSNKLMGQVNLVRYGITNVRDGGSFTLTSGILARLPTPGGAAMSLANAGLEGFTRAAALELPRGLRINVVSPGWVAETLQAMGRDPAAGVAAVAVARAYVAALEGKSTGQVIEVLPP